MLVTKGVTPRQGIKSIFLVFLLWIESWNPNLVKPFIICCCAPYVW